MNQHEHEHNDFDTEQMTFRDLDSPRSIKRTKHHGIQTIESIASPNTASTVRNRKVLKLRWLLWKYIRTSGLNHEFQAIDFSAWASKQPQHEPDLDMRATGGMFQAMVNAGILVQIGFRNNGGNKDTNYHGTPRTVYRVVELDYSKLGWLEDTSGMEQDGVWDDSNPPRRRVYPADRKRAAS